MLKRWAVNETTTLPVCWGWAKKMNVIIKAKKNELDRAQHCQIPENNLLVPVPYSTKSYSLVHFFFLTQQNAWHKARNQAGRGAPLRSLTRRWLVNDLSGLPWPSWLLALCRACALSKKKWTWSVDFVLWRHLGTRKLQFVAPSKTTTVLRVLPKVERNFNTTDLYFRSVCGDPPKLGLL